MFAGGGTCQQLRPAKLPPRWPEAWTLGAPEGELEKAMNWDTIWGYSDDVKRLLIIFNLFYFYFLLSFCTDILKLLISVSFLFCPSDLAPHVDFSYVSQQCMAKRFDGSQQALDLNNIRTDPGGYFLSLKLLPRVRCLSAKTFDEWKIVSCKTIFQFTILIVCHRPGVPKNWSHFESEDAYGSCDQDHWRKHSRGKQCGERFSCYVPTHPNSFLMKWRAKPIVLTHVSSCCCQLTCLNMSNNRIHKLDELAELVTKVPNLKTLNLSHNEVRLLAQSI